MAMVTANGVRLAYDLHGAGDISLVMVHGSWLSRRTWESALPHLAESFRILSYDRRGHGESERPSGQRRVQEDVADLAALIEHLGLAPAWVCGQSFGASIALRLMGERPELLRGLIGHEPPLFALVANDPNLAPMLEDFARTSAEVAERIASGDHAGAAEQFVEEVVGSGRWMRFPPEMRQVIIEQAPTFLDEANDPDSIAFDLEWIRGCPLPALLTQGDQSPPLYAPVLGMLTDAMPRAQSHTFTGAGHVIQADQPKDWAEAMTEFVRRHPREESP